MIRVGILTCYEHYSEVGAVYGDYATQFETLLARAGISFADVQVWRCDLNQFPASPELCDLWIVSGSRSSVFDDEPWIDPLKDFVCRAHAAGKKLMGVCFGHQLIHSALGGVVERSAKGWGLGAYPVNWANPGLSHQPLRILAMHRDQVTALAPGFVVLAGSGFCPNAITILGADVLTFQAHPEFEAGMFAMICNRIRPKIGDQIVDDVLRHRAVHGDLWRIHRLIGDFAQPQQQLRVA